MKINDFIQNFANQFDETDASEFQATTEFVPFFLCYIETRMIGIRGPI